VRKNAVLPRTIGKKVKKRRISLGLTQEELAEKVGISRAYMGFIEQSRNVPSLEILDKIAKALHIKTAELL
jgi:transcriptional regulator with XRE-family HTH domain